MVNNVVKENYEIEEFKIELRFLIKNKEYLKAYNIVKSKIEYIDEYSYNIQLYLYYILSTILENIGTKEAIIESKKAILNALRVSRQFKNTAYELTMRAYTLWQFNILFEKELSNNQLLENYRRILYTFEKLEGKEGYLYKQIELNIIELQKKNKKGTKEKLLNFIKECKKLGYEDLIQSATEIL